MSESIWDPPPCAEPDAWGDVCPPLELAALEDCPERPAGEVLLVEVAPFG
jgi:hypothetical protein